MFLVPMFNGSSWASEIDDDILLFAPAKTSAYIPYNLTQVAVYLEGLLDQTEGYETSDVDLESSVRNGRAM